MILISPTDRIVSSEDVDKLYHHFLRIDADGNGVIDRSELMRLPSVAGNPLASRLLELFDTDQSGDINFSEFVTGLATFSSRSGAETKLKCTD
jgi:serine/threonine-protein phosphatase 2B regulatory subunit